LDLLLSAWHAEARHIEMRGLIDDFVGGVRRH
jgi:hypothetical protein